MIDIFNGVVHFSLVIWTVVPRPKKCRHPWSTVTTGIEVTVKGCLSLYVMDC